MQTKQKLITLWSHENDLCQMRICANITRIYQDMKPMWAKEYARHGMWIYSNKFGFEYNSELICTWNVRFLLRGQGLPDRFYEDFSINVLLSRELLQRYRIRSISKFINTFDFGGYEGEDKELEEFAMKCGSSGIVFLDDKVLEVPQMDDKKYKVGAIPEERPNLSPFEWNFERAAKRYHELSDRAYWKWRKEEEEHFKTHAPLRCSSEKESSRKENVEFAKVGKTEEVNPIGDKEEEENGDKFPKTSSQTSPLMPLDEETEEFICFPPSNQQTLDCDWYKELVNNKHRLTEAKTQDLAQSSTSNQASHDGNTVFTIYILC